MNRKSIADRIVDIIDSTLTLELKQNEQNLDMDIDIIEEFGINSIDAIELLVKIEDEFNIQINDEDLSADLIRTVNNMAEYVEKSINN